MESLLQPTHLFFLLLIVLIIFGPGDLPQAGKGLGRALSSTLFMAKGVNPNIGRDVGDMLPNEDSARGNAWFRCSLAILIGNTLYFASSPLLPAAPRLDSAASGIGVAGLVDFWFCLFVYGVLNLAAIILKRNIKKH